MNSRTDVEALRLVDRRTVKRNMKHGLLTAKDLAAHMASLPDVSEKIAPPEPFPDEVAAAPVAAPVFTSTASALPGTPVSAEAVAAAAADAMAALSARAPLATAPDDEDEDDGDDDEDEDDEDEDEDAEGEKASEA